MVVRAVRPIAVTAAVLAGAGATAVPATAAQAGGGKGPRPVVKLAVPPVRAGIARWVKTWWTTRSDVCDVRVTVAPTGGESVTVTYPSNTGTYTSLSRRADLARGDVDDTAFRVTAASGGTRWITLKLTVAYVNLPNGTLRPGDTAGYPSCAGDRDQATSYAKLLVLTTG
jgi:hypothetical protein